MTQPGLGYTGAIVDAAGASTRLAGELKEIFTTLKTAAAQSVGTDGLSGQYAQAFQKAQTAWDLKADGLSTGHTNLASASARAYENAIGTDKHIANTYFQV